jgi:hypothetical protein
LRALFSDDWPSGELSTLYTHLQRLRESYGLRRRDVVAVLAGYQDDLSKELTFITNVGGFAEILNEGDDLIQGSQRPQRGRRPDPGFAETHRGRRPRRSDSIMIR